MKQFEVVFIKHEHLSLSNSVAKLAKQIINSDSDEILIIPPKGFTLMQVTELLPSVNQIKNKNQIHAKEN